MEQDVMQGTEATFLCRTTVYSLLYSTMSHMCTATFSNNICYSYQPQASANRFEVDSSFSDKAVLSTRWR